MVNMNWIEEKHRLLHGESLQKTQRRELGRAVVDAVVGSIGSVPYLLSRAAFEVVRNPKKAPFFALLLVSCAGAVEQAVPAPTMLPTPDDGAATTESGEILSGSTQIYYGEGLCATHFEGGGKQIVEMWANCRLDTVGDDVGVSGIIINPGGNLEDVQDVDSDGVTDGYSVIGTLGSDSLLDWADGLEDGEIKQQMVDLANASKNEGRPVNIAVSNRLNIVDDNKLSDINFDAQIVLPGDVDNPTERSVSMSGVLKPLTEAEFLQGDKVAAINFPEGWGVGQAIVVTEPTYGLDPSLIPLQDGIAALGEQYTLVGSENGNARLQYYTPDTGLVEPPGMEIRPDGTCILKDPGQVGVTQSCDFSLNSIDPETGVVTLTASGGETSNTWTWNPAKPEKTIETPDGGWQLSKETVNPVVAAEYLTQTVEGTGQELENTTFDGVVINASLLTGASLAENTFWKVTNIEFGNPNELAFLTKEIAYSMWDAYRVDQSLSYTVDQYWQMVAAMQAGDESAKDQLRMNVPVKNAENDYVPQEIILFDADSVDKLSFLVVDPNSPELAGQIVKAHKDFTQGMAIDRVGSEIIITVGYEYNAGNSMNVDNPERGQKAVLCRLPWMFKKLDIDEWNNRVDGESVLLPGKVRDDMNIFNGMTSYKITAQLLFDL